MILEGTTSSGAVVPVQVTADGKVVAEGRTGPEGPEGPQGPEGPPGPAGGNWIQDGIDLHPATDGAEVNLDAPLKFANALHHYASIDGPPDGTGSGGSLRFSTTSSGSTTPVERMRFTQAGNLRYAETTTDFPGRGNNTTGIAFHTDGRAYFSTSDIYGFNKTSPGVTIVFSQAGTDVGNITTTSSSTAYNTSSDYRLKENIAPVIDAVARLKQLKPYRFNFIADPSKTVDGFIAHEAQEVIPECVTGKKDAVDSNGDPIYQGIDQSKLVPLLTAALQEAMQRIEALEKKVNLHHGQ